MKGTEEKRRRKVRGKLKSERERQEGVHRPSRPKSRDIRRAAEGLTRRQEVVGVPPGRAGVGTG